MQVTNVVVQCGRRRGLNDDIYMHMQQAVRLGRRHNMPPPHLDFWPFDLEVGVGVACDLGYPCAKFRLPKPFGFRVRADVLDIRQTDGQTNRRTTDADHRLMLPPTGGGIINNVAAITVTATLYDTAKCNQAQLFNKKFGRKEPYANRI